MCDLSSQVDLTLHFEESFIFRWFYKRFKQFKPNYEIAECQKEERDQFLKVKNNQIHRLRNNLLLQKVKNYFFELKDDGSLNNTVREMQLYSVCTLCMCYNYATTKYYSNWQPKVVQFKN